METKELERKWDGVSLSAEYEIQYRMNDMTIHVIRDQRSIVSVTAQEIMPFNHRLPIEQRIAMALAVRRAGGRDALMAVAAALPNN